MIRRPNRFAGLHGLSQGLLCAVVLWGVWGCDGRAPQTPIVLDKGLDLSSISQGVDGWTSRQVDQGQLPGLDTVRSDGSLWLRVEASKGISSRWRRKVRWPAEEYPLLEWDWTPGSKVDSSRFARRNAPATVLAIDVTLASSFGIHKTIRYVWSARLDRHVQYQRDAWHPKVVVLRDALDSVGRPRHEKVNVWEDFRRLWGSSPRHQALSISVFAHQPDTSKSLDALFGAIVAESYKDQK